MGFFSFNSEFEILVNLPKEEAFERMCSYVNKNESLTQIKTKKFEKLFFTKGTSLFSYPIDFEIIFRAIDDSNTKLSVKSKSGTLDLGKSKGIINDIVKEIYGEKCYCAESENSSYKSWKKAAIIASAFLIVITMLFQALLNEDSDYEYNENSNYEYCETNTSTVESKRTDIEPWMVGKWEGRITTKDYLGNPFRLHWSLDINQYGSTTQITGTSNGDYDVEYFTLKYDRDQEKLYYKEGGHNVTINVNPKTKQLYMPSDFGTLYLNKQ